MTSQAIELRGLTKRFGDFTAVDAIDLDVPAGQIFGFLGPNGSGKTTTIRMMTGTLRPDSGSVRVLGENMIRHAGRVQPRIGYMSQKFALFEDLTVAENLQFYAGVYEVTGAEFANQREYVLEMANLVGREDELTRNLSVGWRQRLALGAATIHRPELLFLDEPTSGVDPVARRQFWDLLYELAASGVTLFVTTHYMEEASHCNRLAFIYRGKIIAEGSPAQIRQDYGHRILEIRSGELGEIQRWLDERPELGHGYAAGATLHLTVAEAASVTPQTLRGDLLGAGFGEVAVTEVEASLEDVFVNLIGQQD